MLVNGVSVEYRVRDIFHELATTLRENAGIDWTLREDIRAHLRLLIKQVLHKYGYPPDKRKGASQTVIEQAETLSSQWAPLAAS